MTHGEAGKGDRIRPFDQKKFSEGYDRAFGVKPMNEIPQFEGFPKIRHLFREVIVTEKIDGTNAQVHVLEDGRVLAASRKRYLLPGQSDNHGFRAWVEAHADELRQLGPGRHFGEWWGQGIQRGYGLIVKRFSLFNVSRWKGFINNASQEPYFDGHEKRQSTPMCCDTVPILYAGLLSVQSSINIVKTIEGLREHGSAAAPGFMRPEGIVVFHAPTNYTFKITLENDDKPKGAK